MAVSDLVMKALVSMGSRRVEVEGMGVEGKKG
jgi:hypothetical protein